MTLPDFNIYNVFSEAYRIISATVFQAFPSISLMLSGHLMDIPRSLRIPIPFVILTLRGYS